MRMFVVVAIAVQTTSGLCANDFLLVKDGVPANVAKAAEAEKAIGFFVAEAAKCGVKFPVVDVPVQGDRNVLFEIAERPPLEEDAFETLPRGNTLVVRGTKRSVRWALNRVLCDSFGVRWIFPNANMVGGADLNEYPPVGKGTVAVSEVRQKPYDFPLGRNPSLSVEGLDRYDGVVLAPMCHNMFADVFQWRKYAFDNSWPEAIMPVRNGKRFVPPKPKKFPPESAIMAPNEYRERWNICFTNPKAADVAIADVLDDLGRRPGHLTRNIEINDNGGMCECENCRTAVGGRRNSVGFSDWGVPYWSFVDKVARGVAKEHGDVLFSAAAYRETTEAPPFRLDSHVFPNIDFEVVEMLDPSVREKRMKMLDGWNRAASKIEIYDYNYGIGFFLLPRIYFTEWPRFMQTIKRTFPSVVAYISETKSGFPFDGPRLQVMMAVLRDVDVDPWDVVREWCTDAVGAAAAPELEKYYRFWDEYWRGERIRRTAWFKNSVASVYMQLRERPTHTFALKRGDMAMCRRLMESVVAKAATPLQKKRAKVLMDYFELAECAATGLLSEYVEPDSIVKDAQTAVEMLAAVPSAYAAIERISLNPYADRQGKLSRKGMFDVSLAHLGSSIALTLPYKDDPVVKAAYARLSGDTSLPMEIRGMCAIWNGAKAANLVPNGSFEQDGPMPENFTGGVLRGTKRIQGDATDGKWSLEVRRADFVWRIPVQTNRTYMLLFDVKDVKGSGEGRFSAVLSQCRSDNVALDSVRSLDNVLPGGKWTSMSLMVKAVHPNDMVAKIRINLWTNKYESGETVLVDNVRLVCLDDLK